MAKFRIAELHSAETLGRDLDGQTLAPIRVLDRRHALDLVQQPGCGD